MNKASQCTLTNPTSQPRQPIICPDKSESLTATLPELHHHMSTGKRHHLNLFRWLEENDRDPAFEVSPSLYAPQLYFLKRKHTCFDPQNFIPNLKSHLLSRLLDQDPHLHPSFSNDDQDNLKIINDLLYIHKVLRVNYTSYNLHRSQDSINPRNHCDIMTLSQESENGDLIHPYSYAR